VPRPHAHELTLLLAALVVGAFLVAFGALHYGFFKRNLLMDTPVYERYGDAVVHGHEIPYRDFSVEYPPGALPVFAAPSLLAARGAFSDYARWFEVLMLLCGAAAAALCGAILGRQRAGPVRLATGTLLAGLAPIALGPVVLSRYDLWPAALTIAALAAVVSDRYRLAFGLLGAAIAAKVYPAVLLPLLVAHVWRRAGRREAAVGAGVLGAVVAACLAPFVVLAPGGVWASLSEQASRPLQIESLGASALLAAHQVGNVTLTEVSSHGSDNLAGALPDRLASTQSLLVVLVLAGLWVGFARGPAATDRLLRYCAAAVCVFIALGKVLSPQYLIWLFALVPLVRGRRGAAASGLFVAAMVLTQLWFPYRYIRLVYELDARASWLVFARDLALVALLVTLAWPERRARTAGISVAGVLAAGAAAAVAAAAVSSTPAAGRMHAGLLRETGIASSCGVAKPTPPTSDGDVHYDVATFPAPGRRGCVRVSVSTKPRIQLFSVAYGRGFDPARPRARYLGDAGICTNIRGATGARLAYGFVAAAREPFAVEVEECGAAQGTLPYVIDVTSTPAPRVRIAAARAESYAGGMRVRWRIARPQPGTTFVLYRESLGALQAVGRAHGASALLDRKPGARARYWIRVETRGGEWAWHGPVATGG
jgi:hypothetical protein